MTLKEAMEMQGNVCKVKVGTRYKYYAYYDLLCMHSDGRLAMFEVTKAGVLKRKKKGIIYDTVINIKDVEEILPINVIPWYEQLDKEREERASKEVFKESANEILKEVV